MATRTHTQQQVNEVILTHIQACNPCTLRSVTQWATAQGYGGSKMVKALHELQQQRLISLDVEDFEDGPATIVILL